MERDNLLMQALGHGMADIYIGGKQPGPNGTIIKKEELGVGVVAEQQVDVELEVTPTTALDHTVQAVDSSEPSLDTPRRFGAGSDQFDWDRFQRLNQARQAAQAGYFNHEPSAQQKPKNLWQRTKDTLVQSINTASKKVDTFDSWAQSKSEQLSKAKSAHAFTKRMVGSTAFSAARESQVQTHEKGRNRSLRKFGRAAMVATLVIGSAVAGPLQQEDSTGTNATPVADHIPTEVSEAYNSNTEKPEYSDAERFYAWVADHPNHNIGESFARLATATPEEIETAVANEAKLVADGFYQYSGIWFQS
jgi:hypothetical protein